MQRFVTYIYGYDEGQKGSNAGYAKIEIRGVTGKLEIHLSGTGVMNGTGEVYLLKGRQEGLEYYQVGEFNVEDGTGIFRMTFKTFDVAESEMEFEQFVGIGIKDSQGKGYLSFWKDIKQTEFRKEYFVQGDRQEQEEQQTNKKELVSMEQPENANQSQDGLEMAEQEALHTLEIPVRNVFPKSNLADIWEVMQQNRLSVQINEAVSAIQIELKDLRELPKQYWYLGNNSFLLHGFFNYRYLLLGKLPEGSWFLGVPGVYQKQERVMAAIFGFPGFLAAGEMRGVQISGEKGEATPNLQAAETGVRELQPGAWYHILED